jgi:hypothetical protein
MTTEEEFEAFRKVAKSRELFSELYAKAAAFDAMREALTGLLAQNDKWSERPESGLPPLKETLPEKIARAALAHADEVAKEKADVSRG